jgi:hypothetical protein
MYVFGFEFYKVGILVNVKHELPQRFLELEDLEVIQKQFEVVQGVHLEVVVDYPQQMLFCFQNLGLPVHVLIVVHFWNQP